MKNIHILPTPNPSKLGFIFEANSYHIFTNGEDPYDMADNLAHYRNLYVTNDEEIKEGDWVLKPDNTTHKMADKDILSYIESQSNATKKIILTTDQDLIKDGIQEIPDKFLEWFIKNSGCEKVEVGKWNSLAECGYSYHINIPKEEVKYSIKKEYVDDQDAYGYDVLVKEETKQETPEEAAERYLKEQNVTCLDVLENVITLDGIPFNQKERIVNAFVKWQQEKSYAKEDMEKAYMEGCKNPSLYKTHEEKAKEWFKQFRNK
jgi:hypothetical protein